MLNVTQLCRVGPGPGPGNHGAGLHTGQRGAVSHGRQRPSTESSGLHVVAAGTAPGSEGQASLSSSRGFSADSSEWGLGVKTS